MPSPEFMVLVTIGVAMIGGMVTMLNHARQAVGEARKECEDAKEAADSVKDALARFKELRTEVEGLNGLLLRSVEDSFLQLESLVFSFVYYDGPEVANNKLVLEHVMKRAGLARGQIALMKYLQVIRHGDASEVYAAVNYLLEHGSSGCTAVLKERLGRGDLPAYLLVQLERAVSELSQRA